jgi:hypothetical protein
MPPTPSSHPLTTPRLWQNLLTTDIISHHKVAEVKMFLLFIAP